MRTLVTSRPRLSVCAMFVTPHHGGTYRRIVGGWSLHHKHWVAQPPFWYQGSAPASVACVHILATCARNVTCARLASPTWPRQAKLLSEGSSDVGLHCPSLECGYEGPKTKGCIYIPWAPWPACDVASWDTSTFKYVLVFELQRQHQTLKPIQSYFHANKNQNQLSAINEKKQNKKLLRCSAINYNENQLENYFHFQFKKKQYGCISHAPLVPTLSFTVMAGSWDIFRFVTMLNFST